eukprot:scaffold4891_cov28-Attheya_sp.AAC.2
MEEGIAGPPANHHDCVNRNVGKVHGHRGAGADRMGANVFGFDAQFVFADHDDGSTEANSKVVAGEVAKLLGLWVVHCIHCRLGACSWAGKYSLDHGGPCHNGAHISIAGSVHGDSVISLVILLELEGDGDGEGHAKTLVIMFDQAVATEETDVHDAQEFGSTVLDLGGDFQIFAGPHGEVEGTGCELAGRNVFE